MSDTFFDEPLDEALNGYDANEDPPEYEPVEPEDFYWAEPDIWDEERR